MNYADVSPLTAFLNLVTAVLAVIAADVLREKNKFGTNNLNRANYLKTYAPPAMTFLHLRHFQIPVACLLTLYEKVLK